MNRKNILTTLVVLFVVGSVLYFVTTREQVPANQESVESSVRVIGGLDSYGTPASEYTVDNAHAYYEGKLINADHATLEVLKGSLEYMKDYILYLYARDARTVYYEGKPLPTAVPATFRPIENGGGIHNYGTDGETVYFGFQPIPGADSKNFEILWQTIHEGCGKTNYSKDLMHVYVGTAMVPNADAATFESLINGFGKDKRGYYKGPTYVGPTIDSNDLVCNYG